MNFLESLKQLKAFARQDGAILALVWIVSFLFTMKLPQSMVGNVLTLSTPLVVAWRLRAFRNNALDGEISYRQMQESVKLLGTLQPIELVFLFFTQNVLIGFFLSLIIAAFGMKRRQ